MFETDPQIGLRIYELMVLTRKVEERINALVQRGIMRERPHASIGQEAVGVASAICLQQDDWVIPSLRARGVFITKGVPLELIFAEGLEKAGGSSCGKWTSHHLHHAESHVLLGSAIVGGSIPVAVGAALAQKYKKTNKVVMAYFGDGATSRGDFHEGLNLAAVQNVPLVLICENNFYAISTPLDRQMRIKNIAERALAYGISNVTIDGNDAEEVYLMTAKAVERARAGEGPTFIEARTYRWRGHSELYSPDHGRSKSELEEWMARCPIIRLEEALFRTGLLNGSEVDRIAKEASTKINAAVEMARRTPDPKPLDLYTNIYA